MLLGRITLTDLSSRVEVDAGRCSSPAGKKGHALLCRLFFLLRTGPGTAVVGGPKMLIPTCPPMQSFARMSLRQREGILQYWATGPIPLLRKVRCHWRDMYAAWQHSHVIPSRRHSWVYAQAHSRSADPMLQLLWPSVARALSNPEQVPCSMHV